MQKTLKRKPRKEFMKKYFIWINTELTSDLKKTFYFIHALRSTTDKENKLSVPLPFNCGLE